MKTLSERLGLKPMTPAFQNHGMSAELRNRLWDMVVVFYLQKANEYDQEYGDEFESIVGGIMKLIWHNHLKEPIDSIDEDWDVVKHKLRKYFFECQWNEIYDFIQFVSQFSMVGRIENPNQRFMDGCNKVLEEENSAYRFVGGEIIPIIREEQIASVENARNDAQFLPEVFTHLES